nr:CDP-glucose 4,6-dehydratase [Lujinxingiaceae bacterium]
ALDPPTEPSLFDVADIQSALATDTRADLADLEQLTATFRTVRPQAVFHLAAQSLVRESYRDPLATLNSNVIGTAHVLEAARLSQSNCAVLVVTTDKVYANRESPVPYNEADPLGGHDPYSASKAAAEIIAASYRASFCSDTTASIRVATARAGNVIGGGDWAAERLVPDCLRAFENRRPVQLRFPDAVRPWQHVFEPLAGYLALTEKLLGVNHHNFSRAWNFGPDACGDATVGHVANALAQLWGPDAVVENAADAPRLHEAQLLSLDSTCARVELGWQPRWSLQQALTQTVAWHRGWKQGADMAALSVEQIHNYLAAVRP